MATKMDPAHLETEKIISRIEAQVKREYAQAAREMEDKVSTYAKRFDTKDKTWRRWVATGYKTQADYTKWRVGQLAIGERWEEMRDTLAHDLLHTREIATSIALGYMPEVYALNHDYGTFLVEKGSLMDTSYTLYSREAAERIFREDPKMMPGPGKKTAKEIAEGKLIAYNNKRVQSTMMQAILQGDSIPDIAQRLSNAVCESDMGACIRNARTMATAAQNAGRVDSFKRANDMGIKTRKQWLATLDSRTRHWHRTLDGQTVDNDKPFEVDGMEIEYPGDPSAPPKLVWNCRCTLICSIEGYERNLSDLVQRDMVKLEHMTYAEWKADKKSVSQGIMVPKEKGEAIRAKHIREYRGFGGKVAEDPKKSVLNVD